MSVAFKQAKWKEAGKGPGGTRTMTIDPPPELVEPITLDVFERGMLLLGLDPDAVLSGTQSYDEVERPPLKNAQSFVDLALKNSESYDLRAMPVQYAEGFLTVVAGYFISAARRN